MSSGYVITMQLLRTWLKLRQTHNYTNHQSLEIRLTTLLQCQFTVRRQPQNAQTLEWYTAGIYADFHFITRTLDADFQKDKYSLLLLVTKTCALGSFISRTKLAMTAHLSILWIYTSLLAYPTALPACFNANEHTESVFIGKADPFWHESLICSQICVFLISITSYKQTAIPVP